MVEIYRKNEYETNEMVSKSIRFLFIFIIIIGAFCWLHIFDVSAYLINGFILLSVIPMLLPSVLVDLLHICRPWVKYVLMLCVIIVTGVAYVIFTFQVIMIFLLPAILSVIYLDQKLFLFSGAAMCINILLSHLITGYHLFMPWIEPFSGVRSILLYGALPRILQYLCCSLLLYLLCKRYLGFLDSCRHIIEAEDKKTGQENQTGQKEELTQILSLLTGRETEIFALLVQGYTNTQISNQLYLSLGTVKNYISILYDKLDTRDRTALIIKFGPYYRNYGPGNDRL